MRLLRGSPRLTRERATVDNGVDGAPAPGTRRLAGCPSVQGLDHLAGPQFLVSTADDRQSFSEQSTCINTNCVNIGKMKNHSSKHVAAVAAPSCTAPSAACCGVHGMAWHGPHDRSQSPSPVHHPVQPSRRQLRISIPPPPRRRRSLDNGAAPAPLQSFRLFDRSPLDVAQHPNS